MFGVQAISGILPLIVHGIGPELVIKLGTKHFIDQNYVEKGIYVNRLEVLSLDSKCVFYIPEHYAKSGLHGIESIEIQKLINRQWIELK